MGRATFTPFVMNFSFRASAAFDFGPGGTATIFGPRSAFVVRFTMGSWLRRELESLALEKGMGRREYRLSMARQRD